MAEPKNNGFTREKLDVRLYRLMRMQNNIDTYAVELAVAGPLLVWAQGCHTRFSDAVTAAQVEAGESKDATIMVHDKFAATLDYYQQAKELLIAMLEQYKPDDILLASYGVGKPTPRTYLDLTEAIDIFAKTNTRLVAEGDPRVIAQAIVDQMVILGNEFEAELETAGIEEREKDVAFQQQHSYFNEDTVNLRWIFKIACMVWGDDDPKLKDLGFVPSSEIWTPGKKLPPPEFFNFEADKDEFTWGIVEGATRYEAQFREKDGGIWAKLFETENPPYIYDGFTQEVWEVRIRGEAPAQEGEWSEIIEINIPFGKPNLQYKAIARLLWCDPVAGAINYQFQCDDPDMGIVQTGPNPTYNVPLPQPTDWKFRARAGNMEGQWGEWSDWLLVPVA